MTKLKLVCIEWIDAEAPGDTGWDEDDPESEPHVLKTFGLLVRKDKNYVVHASTFDPRQGERGKWSERAKIPAGMVQQIIELGEFEIE